ncbi:unnamed protein product [Closterium sp. NIES-65]|nr:unnamed protein product [Closterium sp. NIES-65]
MEEISIGGGRGEGEGMGVAMRDGRGWTRSGHGSAQVAAAGGAAWVRKRWRNGASGGRRGGGDEVAGRREVAAAGEAAADAGAEAAMRPQRGVARVAAAGEAAASRGGGDEVAGRREVAAAGEAAADAGAEAATRPRGGVARAAAASEEVATTRLSLRPQRTAHTFCVFLERFKAVGVERNNLIQPTMALNSRGEGILAASLAGPNFYPSAASHSHPSSHPPNSRLPPTPSSLAPSWGEGILAASLAGPNFYPSAAYARINGNTDVGRIVVAGPGKAPLDDYLTYRFNIPVLLYGDFMSATIDEDGNVWAAVEYVGGVERTDYSD